MPHLLLIDPVSSRFMPYTVPIRMGAKNIAAQAEIFLISSFWF
jgi:hypothetical protein